MSNRPHLPPETLDYIVDLLHDEPETLERCCLVSKSWMPRTRKHLFADVKFRSTQDVDSWKTAFPDHSNSPAYHTHTLFVCWTRVEADAWAGGLIQTFSHVVRLRLTQATFGTPSIVKQFSLAPFHNLSPTLKSLHVYFVSLPCTQLFDFVRSSPLLEDLALSGRDLSSGNDDTPREPQTVGPSPSPVFTGSLDLDIIEGMGNIAHRLLDLPNGLHFRKLTFSWAHEEDLRWIIESVRKCSNTLECLDVKCHPPCTFVLVLRWAYDLPWSAGGSDPASIDLSKAKKLKDAVFWPGSLTVTWIVVALRTITSKHRNLKQISIRVPYAFTLIDAEADIGRAVGEAVCGQWLDLDRLLVEFWEARSIRTKVILAPKMWEGKQDMGYCVGCLLPEATRRGIIDLVKPTWSW